MYVHIVVHIVDTYMCFLLEFKPPQIVTQCFNNVTFYTKWTLLPDQVLSDIFLRRGWLLSGNFTYNSIVLVSTCSKAHAFLILIS